MRFGARQAADALGGRLLGADVEVDGVAFDSRSIRAGQLFVPIVAERDGHDFVEAALVAGAAATLTARPARVPPGASAIVVPDTLEALLRLGAWGRQRWATADTSRRVVGITGSVGKTSTKDLAAAALAAAARTWANERSFNNDQGLPTTILEAPDDTEVMILEMGMRGFGEIARLAGIAQPHIGVVTAVAEAHTERVGSIEGVARAKGELIESLPPDGVAVLNADQPLVRAMRERTSAPAVLVGESDDADVRVEHVRLDELARATFTARTPWGHVEVRLPVSGRHMALNAAAALAVAGALGHDVERAAAALGVARLTPMRMDVRRLASGVVLVDDSYNANPTSMRAALDALAALPVARRVAVLGRMAEVADSEAAHRSVAAHATQLGIELIAVGTADYGVEPMREEVELLERLDELGSVAGGGAVLVKASRAAGLDRLAVVIVERHGGFLLEERHRPA